VVDAVSRAIEVQNGMVERNAPYERVGDRVRERSSISARGPLRTS
jgi:hypothetical protein